MDAITDTNVGLVVPTFNAGTRWVLCLRAISAQVPKPYRLLAIDSSSTDDTAALAAASGFETIRIEKSQFNHGGTRQRAVEYLSDCGIIVFLTQDAILAESNSIEQIVRCFDDPTVAVAYGRQMPHERATPIEAHARIFNYGPKSMRKDSAVAQVLKSKVFFCSNSFAAYRRSTMLKVGGFRDDLILGEDMEFAARAIKAGYANYYCSGAPVFHSHDYKLGEIIARYFDIGVFDDGNAWMREQFGSHKAEGMRFIRSELRYLAAHAPTQIPRALTQTAAKLVGYRLGRIERKLPIGLKRKLSMMPSYWR